MKRFRFQTGCWLAGMLCSVLVAQNAAEPVSFDAETVEAELEAAMESRIDVAHNSVGIVVGMLTPEGRRYLAHGTLEKDGRAEVGPDTIYEIGSISKLFTSLLLAQMVVDGEMSLDDPVAMYLPDGVTAPSRNGIEITLVDLATHTSGLPRMATNFAPANQNNPYADYTPELLYEFLSTYELPRDPGESWEYSNLGVGLLGHILELHTGMPYEELLRTRILDPLGMDSTGITLTREQLSRTAKPYSTEVAMAEVSMWDLGVLKGAGAIRSTAADMLTFAEGWLNEEIFSAEKALMLSASRPSSAPNMQQHLGWIEIGGRVLFHDGATGGYQAAITILPAGRLATVVLSNSTQYLSEMALHAVIPAIPLTTFEAPKQRTEVAVSAEILEQYVGTYVINPETSVDITLQEGRLYAQTTGFPKHELGPESETEFSDRTNPMVTLKFFRNQSGEVASMRIDLPDSVLMAQREGVSPAAEVAEEVGEEILESYVGVYQLASNFTVTVTREGSRLFEQATNQPRFELYPDSETEFHLRVVPARFTFERNEAGKVTGLVLNQNGRDIPGQKIE